MNMRARCHVNVDAFCVHHTNHQINEKRIEAGYLFRGETTVPTTNTKNHCLTVTSHY